MPLVASAICPRQRSSTTRPHIPIPAEQRAQRSEINRERREEVYAGIAAWETYTLSKAEELGERFNKHPRYFLDLFYQATSRLTSRHEKPNGFNVYKCKQMSEMRESMLIEFFYLEIDTRRVGGVTVNLIDIQPSLAEEWNGMTLDEKAKIVKEFEEEWSGPVIKRPSARSRISDVSNIKQNMQALVRELYFVPCAYSSIVVDIIEITRRY